MCMKLVELTSHDLMGQATCPPRFYHAVLDPSPAERWNDLWCKPVGLEWPIEPLHRKATGSMEEAGSLVSPTGDDAFQQPFVKTRYFRRSPHSAPAFPDAEVITRALVQELAGDESQPTWGKEVKKNELDLFPHRGDRTREGRRLRRLRSGSEPIRRPRLCLSGADRSRLRVVERFPISRCQLRRLPGSTQPVEDFAPVGDCASQKESFSGLRMPGMTDARGVAVGSRLTAGPVHDPQGRAFWLP